MAKAKTVVENPVLIAVKITRTSKDGDRKLTTFEPRVIVSAGESRQVCQDLNATVVNKPECKTAREFIVCPTTGDGNEVVPVIADAEGYALSNERAAKRKALAAIPDETRAALGLPDADADDSVIDAWTPNAATASK